MKKKKKKQQKHPQKPTSIIINNNSNLNNISESADEDLSLQRQDEATALAAIYGPDFSLEPGAWNSPLYELRLPSHSSSSQLQVTLQLQLGRNYPRSPPQLRLSGLPQHQMTPLLTLLHAKAQECAAAGRVMGWELAQLVEQFLIDPPTELDKHSERDSALEQAVNKAASAQLDSDIQKELARQIEALDVAAQMRQRKKVGIAATLPIREDADENVDLDNIWEEEDGVRNVNIPFNDLLGSLKNLNNSQSVHSRYQTDFVEIAPLGRGGGGEVVKAINRLDRRIYAIKKVFLESENAEEEENSNNSIVSESNNWKRNSKNKKSRWANIQNEKLRREVTTISRMTHKNIVRYYQAWVEGGQAGFQKRGAILEEEALEKKKVQLKNSHEQHESNQNQHSDYNDEDSTKFSWFSSSTSCSSSSTTNSSSSCESKNQKQHQETDYPRSLSLDNFLEQEIAKKSNSVDPFLEELLEYPQLLPDSPSLNSSVVNLKQILYIQMEYCQTTMRDMIDQSKLSIDSVWKSLHQILEALSYIHGPNINIIHRDLKPSNIFLDTEGEIRLGDFGLATSRKEHNNHFHADFVHTMNASRTVGGLSTEYSSLNSITGGVGTTFYMAPEQESIHGNGKYDSKADIFSLGVLLFEMFHLCPFTTYMERAEVLTVLRGDAPISLTKDSRSEKSEILLPASLFAKDGSIIGDWKELAKQRFPVDFRESVPENAQKIILWCLDRNPESRPSAKQLLSCGLLPRKVELEQRYLDEVLQTLSNPQSVQSYQLILSKLFQRPNPKHILTTFDTDVLVNAASNSSIASHLLIKSLSTVKGSYWGSHSSSFSSSPMSAYSIAAAAHVLRHAKYVGYNNGGGKEAEALRGAPQQVAAILAMRAAASAAVTGSVLGWSDPHIVDWICSKLSAIFRSHGAVHLRSPSLRPRDQAMDLLESVHSPAELLNRQGYVLLLQEDLTVNFARAVARAGVSANNVKRYDIGTVYHESDTGGHPKEFLEASYDIIQELSNSESNLFEAETLLVLCRVMSLLSPKRGMEKIVEMPLDILKPPIWFLRLSHTRLTDALMDLLDIPKSEATRQSCRNIFTRATAPNPLDFYNQRTTMFSGKDKQKIRELRGVKLALAEKCLLSAIENEKLPRDAAAKLRTFITYGNSLPYPIDAMKALDVIHESLRKVNVNCSTSQRNVNKGAMRSFEEVVSCIHQIRGLLKAMENIGIVSSAASWSKDMKYNMHVSCPLYVSLDLGLRQKHLHYHGGIVYQAILLQDDFYKADPIASSARSSTKGVRIAEGGRYDELVRNFRPPGNFGNIQFNGCTSAPIPCCIGLRVNIAKVLDRIYHNATSHDSNQSLKQYSLLDNIRIGIGYPFEDASTPIQCIVSSENGLDIATINERAAVASLLWKNGISCEYVAHSGLVMSLLNHFWSNNKGFVQAAHEWNLEMICAICAIIKIPFIVIVVPHLLSSKNVVKLRSTTKKISAPEQYNYIGSEELVSLPLLPSFLLERLSSDNDVNSVSSTSQGINTIQVQSHQNVHLDCIYVETDQYYDYEHKGHKIDNANWKHIRKLMKSSTEKLTGHLNSIFNTSSMCGQNIPVIAIDLPFHVVRDLGSALMFEGHPSWNNSALTTKYPEHKKIFRTTMYALDSVFQKTKSFAKIMPEKEINDSKNSSLMGQHFPLFLYSLSSDKYDLLTLSMR